MKIQKSTHTQYTPTSRTPICLRVPPQLVLVMEFLPGGDLLQRLRKAKRPLQERVLRKVVTDVCSGMAFLHREAFVHGDLKSANVMFDAAGTAKART